MLNNLLTSLATNNPSSGAISKNGISNGNGVQASQNSVAANSLAGEGQGVDSLFSQVLNNVNLENIADVSDSLIPLAQIGDGELTELNVENQLSNNILANQKGLVSEEASNYLSQVISNQPSLSAVQNSNPNFVEIPTDEVLEVANIAKPQINSLDSITKNSLPEINQLSDKKADLSVVENLVANNSTTKKDDRILGQDNLESFAFSKKNDYLNKAIELVSNASRNPFGLPQSNLISENQNKSQKGEINLNSSLYTDGESVFNRHIDGTHNKNAEVKSELNFREVAQEQNYKVASFSKGKNSIELHLEPAHLGKVSIKFDFGAEGKPAIMVLADKSDTLDMLKKDSSEIQKILNDNGIKADSGSLSFNLNSGGNSEAYQQAQESWSRGNSLFAFSLEQDFQNLPIIDNANNANDNSANYAISSGSLYRGNLAYGMLNILV